MDSFTLKANIQRTALVSRSPSTILRRHHHGMLFRSLKITAILLIPVCLLGQARRINNRRMCDQFPGPTEGAKIMACISDLGPAGGIADATGLIKSGMTISSWVDVDSPVTLLLGPGDYNVSATMRFKNQESLKVIGAGPLLTHFRWTGAANGTMFELDDIGVGSIFSGFSINATTSLRDAIRIINGSGTSVPGRQRRFEDIEIDGLLGTQNIVNGIHWDPSGGGDANGDSDYIAKVQVYYVSGKAF